MMGIQPADARAMPWQEYQARLAIWNERHDPEAGNEPAEAPDPDFVRRRQQRLADRGLSKAIH